MQRMLCFLFVLSLSVLAACHKKQLVECGNLKNPHPSTLKEKDPFSYLYYCMKGNFSSIDQSKTDSTYFDIRLRMVPVWQKEDNVFYLYVEQAMSTSLAKPYRQRFYKVEKLDETHFVSHIYTVNNPLRFVGLQEGNAIFNSLSPDSLKIKDGCEVYMEYFPEDKNFRGSTKEKACPSERSGAAYATAKVELNESEMRSWDQGWNEAGKQMWGATKGAYIFRKIQE